MPRGCRLLLLLLLEDTGIERRRLSLPRSQTHARTHAPRPPLLFLPPTLTHALPPSPLVGTAMSARKTSLTERQSKNGTSKYVLERCASINEYYDIAFKVCMSVSGLFVFTPPPPSLVVFGCASLKREPRGLVFSAAL